MNKTIGLPKNIRQIGEIQGKEKICIEDYVMTYIRRKEPQEEQGYLGVFLGEYCTGEESEYLFIRGILEVPEEEEPQKLKEALQHAEISYFPGWQIIGCCIIGTYPTKRLEMLSSILPEAGQMIYHLQEQEETIYWKKQGEYQRINGYFVFYEQNKKMQNYMAEVFQNVQKEKIPDDAIKTFRKKVKEKGEEKSRSMLRVASSFFVVTVLLAGAIAVKRMEQIRTEQKDILSVNAIIDKKEDVQEINTQNVIPETNYMSGSASFWEEETEEMQDLTAEVSTQMTGEESETEKAAVLQEADSRQIMAAYVIKEGDTLAAICKKYYGDMDHLEKVCDANAISDANVIMPGQKIVLP